LPFRCRRFDDRRVAITYEWRGDFENADLNRLHAEGFGHGVRDDDWRAQLDQYSLGWACATRDGELAGFVNVAWDGGVHAFILDTLVAVGARREGIGTTLVRLAAGHASAAGCEWLHVDFDDDLGSFYFQACGFRPTRAGLIALEQSPAGPVQPRSSPHE
jgi:ribosomal protein S18 acetylase RimI-like enzyme